MKTQSSRNGMPNGLSTVRPVVVVLGLESVGKSSLLSALTGRFAESSALSGTTLRCERYPDATWDWVDTPGIVTGSDAATVRDTLGALASAESILVVVRAHRAKKELASLLPMLGSRKVAIILTFRDRLAGGDGKSQSASIAAWRAKLDVPVALVNGRSPEATDLANVRAAVMEAKPLPAFQLEALPEFSEIQRRAGGHALERFLGFPPVSLLLLFGPAWIAVTQANAFADRSYDSVAESIEPLLGWLGGLPAPFAATLGGDYGVVAMFPFLLLYALPTILIFTGLIAIYKSTGLIDRLPRSSLFQSIFASWHLRVSSYCYFVHQSNRSRSRRDPNKMHQMTSERIHLRYPELPESFYQARKLAKMWMPGITEQRIEHRFTGQDVRASTA